jgi:predicted nucleotidyltransferase
MISLSTIKKELKPLLKLKGNLELVYIFGSFKSRNYNDVDILIIVNDETKKGELALINSVIKEIKKKSKISFHFQGVKYLGAWWRAIIEGEPWILTSLNSSIAIYDNFSIIKSLKKLLKKEKTYNKESRIDKLIESSNNYEVEIREVLLKSISDLSNIATEVSQIYLLKKNIVAIDKRKILKHLKTNLSGDYVDVYREVIDLERKYQKGFLTEFTSENLEYYLEKIQLFIKKLEKGY